MVANLRPKLGEARLVDRPPPFAAGLTLESMRLEPLAGERRIVGVLRNSAAEPRRDVTVRFELRTFSTGKRDTLDVRIPLVPANGDVEFRTDPILPNVDKCNLESIEAAP